MSEREPEATDTSTATTGTTATGTDDMHTSIGPDANILAAVGYVFWILAVLFFFIEDESDFLRFHALQAAVLGVVLFVVFMVAQVALFFLTVILSFVSDVLGSLLGLLFPLIGLGVFLVLLFGAFKAFQGERYKFPLIGDFVEGQI
ncbi:hypothetical protein BRD00_04675 [Halobacteriales archaeon QS_8_69_26]|nr:MAG: hypothetical protein BRD00_04675 [Halobacteriales archaeon QS_8_69_26]